MQIINTNSIEGVASMFLFCNILILLNSFCSCLVPGRASSSIYAVHHASGTAFNNIILPAAQPSWWYGKMKTLKRDPGVQETRPPGSGCHASGRVGSIHGWKCRRRRFQDELSQACPASQTHKHKSRKCENCFQNKLLAWLKMRQDAYLFAISGLYSDANYFDICRALS